MECWMCRLVTVALFCRPQFQEKSLFNGLANTRAMTEWETAHRPKSQMMETLGGLFAATKFVYSEQTMLRGMMFSFNSSACNNPKTYLHFTTLDLDQAGLDQVQITERIFQRILEPITHITDRMSRIQAWSQQSIRRK